MLPIILLMLLIAGRAINADTIWYDEWYAIYYAGSSDQVGDVSLVGTWERVAGEFHELNPPGYYLLLNLWSDFNADHPAVLRWFSLLSGVLALAFVYRAGTDIHSPSVGWIAALLLGTSAFFLTYTHEIRAYMLYAMLAIAAVTIYHHLITHPVHPSPAGYLAFGLCVAALLYTHYMAALLIAALGLYHLLFVPKNKRWWQITAAAVLAALLFIPWLVRGIEAIQQVNSDPTRDYYARTPGELITRLLNAFSNGNLLIMLVLAWVARRDARLLGFIITITFALAALANALIGFLTDVHYLLALFPLLALIAALGMIRLPRARGVIVGAWVVVGIGTVIFPPPLEPHQFRKYVAWDDLLATLQPYTAPYDGVRFALPEPDPRWIYDDVLDYYTAALNYDVDPIESIPYKPVGDYAAAFVATFDETHRLWIAYDHRPAHQPSPLALLARDQLVTTEQMVRCGDPLVGETITAALFMRPPAGGWLAQWGDGVQFGRSDWSPHIPPHGIMTVPLMSRITPQTPADRYAISAQLTAPDGTLVYQHDAPLPNADPIGCIPLHIPVDNLLPSQPYTLYATVYNWQTGERLPIETSRYPVTDNRRLELLVFQIPPHQ